mmetsp:Transcript_792/g.1188  ORF Transcript_792/g.1188 Transcript_792/m.1188 type:complete len:174 (-) Transcript_792:50-571(-)
MGKNKKASGPKVGGRLGSVPSWVWGWFLIGGLLVVWDSLYVLNRPDSLTGNLKHFWPGYENYVRVDYRYEDHTDGISKIQCFMNGVEVSLTLIAFFLRDSDPRTCWIAIFISALMTFWKTVLYMGADAINDYRDMDVNRFDFYLYYFAPSIWWIILPFLITRLCCKRFYHSLA